MVVALGLGLGAAVYQDRTIVGVASGNPDFETLVSAVQAADLVGTLQGPGPFTVFAPTDAAFEAVPAAQRNALMADQERLRGVLTYHVVAGTLNAADLQGRSYVETVNGARLPVRVRDGMVMVGNATVRQADVAASNGVVHVIDRVLMPPAGMRVTK
jgi:uncharacterized surface protein with fasciclin (FAS1) repeats